jgi:hypothetical protein
MTSFALVLFLGAAAGWIAAKGAPPHARAYLRLAAVIYAALALGAFGLDLFAAAPKAGSGFALSGLAVVAVTDLVVTLAPAVLCVAAYAAFRRAPHGLPAGLILGVAALIGVAAAATGMAVLAAVPQVLSAVFTFFIARPGLWRRASVYLALAAISMLGGAACQLTPGLAAHAGVLLFEAAALIGVAVASNVFVEQRPGHARSSEIRSMR